jgi:hypothetical protein
MTKAKYIKDSSSLGSKNYAISDESCNLYNFVAVCGMDKFEM